MLHECRNYSIESYSCVEYYASHGTAFKATRYSDSNLRDVCMDPVVTNASLKAERSRYVIA